jgi:hypothetical protein
MGGRQVGLVVDGVRVHAIATRRLQRDEGIAQVEAGDDQVLVMHIGLAGRGAPLALHPACRAGKAANHCA